MNKDEGSPAPESAAPGLHELYRRWSGKKTQDGRLPSAGDIGFDEFLEQNPGAAYITIGQHPDGTPRYFYSRVGPTHRAVLGRDVEGYWLDEIVDNDQIAQYETTYNNLVAERRAHYWMRLNTPVSGKRFTFERMLVPVSEDGKTVDGLIGVWIWIDS